MRSSASSEASSASGSQSSSSHPSRPTPRVLILNSKAPAQPFRYDYEVDVLVVGVGTAGSQLAGLLSTKYRVLALEAGKDLRADPITGNPANAFSVLAYDATYSAVTLTRTVPAIGNNRLNFTAGIMLGGSGEHNQALAVNPSPQRAQQWADALDTRWAPSNIYPTLATTETFTATADGPPFPDNRGFSGPLQIRQGPSSAYSVAFANSVANVVPGVTVQPDIPANTTYNSGTGSVASIDSESFLDAEGVRSSPDRVYLGPDVMAPAGDGVFRGVNGHRLLLILDAPVNRILWERTDGGPPGTFDERTDPSAFVRPLRAVGVQFQRNGTIYNAKASRVIVSLGAIGSPMLLYQSGVGDATVLRANRLPVLLDQPLIGRHMATQYGPIFTFRTNEFSLQSGAPSFLPLGDTDRQFQLITFPAGPNTYSVLMWNLLPRSTGTILPTNWSNFYRYDIDPRFYTDPGDLDRQRTLEGMRLLYQILLNFRATASPSLTFVTPPEAVLAAPPSPASDAALFAFVRPPSFSMADHYCGTVSMGKDASINPVDERFKLRGTSNVYVVDASVTPNVADPDGTVYPLQNDGNTIRQINAFTQIATQQFLAGFD